MYSEKHGGSWTYGLCEACLKNAHESIRMVRESVGEGEMWVCPQCGSTKTL